MTTALTRYQPTGLHHLPYRWEGEDRKEIKDSQVREWLKTTTTIGGSIQLNNQEAWLYSLAGATILGFFTAGPIGAGAALFGADKGADKVCKMDAKNKTLQFHKDHVEYFSYELKRIEAIQQIANSVLKSFNLPIPDFKTQQAAISDAKQGIDSLLHWQNHENRGDKFYYQRDRGNYSQIKDKRNLVWMAEFEKLAIVINQISREILNLYKTKSRLEMQLTETQAKLGPLNEKERIELHPKGMTYSPISYVEPQISKPTPLNTNELNSCFRMLDDITNLAKAILRLCDVSPPDVSAQQRNIDSSTTTNDTRCSEKKTIARLCFTRAAEALHSLQEEVCNLDKKLLELLVSHKFKATKKILDDLVTETRAEMKAALGEEDDIRS